MCLSMPAVTSQAWPSSIRAAAATERSSARPMPSSPRGPPPATLARNTRLERGLIQERPVLFPRSLFSVPADPLKLAELSAALSGGPLADAVTSAPQPSSPVIGIYGKPGPEKGIAELLAAAGELRAQGARFSILVMTGGETRELRWLGEQIESNGLQAAVSVIPFLPHWRVPEFLAACDCVSCLEHGFSVPGHRPQVPREVTTAGCCLLVSREVADGEPAILIDGENALIVDDPRDRRLLVRALRRAVLEPELRERIAASSRGAYGWTSEHECAEWTRRFVALIGDLSKLKRGWSMSLQAFQRTLLRIYADPRYRRALMADPAAVSTVEGLSPPEAQSLEALLGDREGLLRYCEGIVDKRLRHLEGQFSDVLDAYPSVKPALRAEFRDTWVLRDLDAISELREFERLLLQAGTGALDPEPRAGFTQWVRYAGMCARVTTFADETPEPAPEERVELRLALAPGSELAVFTGRLLSRAGRSTPAPGPWPPLPTAIGSRPGCSSWHPRCSTRLPSFSSPPR